MSHDHDSSQTGPPQEPADRPHSGQPRDGLFRFVFSQPEHTASELRSVLPSALLTRLDLNELRLVPGSFVDAALRQQHTDALFTTRWSGHPAYLYVLLEHQSSPDPLMAWRMLRYQVRIWEQHLARDPGASRLPVIVPIVIYQGRRRWKVSTDFADLLDLDPDLRNDEESAGAVVPRFGYLLDDLSSVQAPGLRARPLTEEAQLALGLLGAPTGFEDPEPVLGPWREILTVIRSHPGGQHLLATVATYIWNISNADDQRMREFMATMEPHVAETFTSTYERIIARGRTQGKAEGKAEDLLTVLEARGIAVPDHARNQILACTDLTLLHTWLRRAVNAHTFDDLDL